MRVNGNDDRRGRERPTRSATDADARRERPRRPVGRAAADCSRERPRRHRRHRHRGAHRAASRDRNGPWLAERLRELGVDARAHRRRRRPAGGHARARWASSRAQGIDLVVTSGGLGPTADDLTAEVVGGLPGPRARCSTRRSRSGSRRSSAAARRAGPTSTRREPARRQPQAGAGARGRDGARAGRHRARASSSRRRRRRPTVVVLPGPPRELQPMWAAAVETDALRAARSRARRAARSRCCACSGSRSRRSPRRCARPRRTASTSTRSRSRRACAAARSRSSRATRRRPPTSYDAFEALVRERHARARCSPTTARRSTSRSPRLLLGRR